MVLSNRIKQILSFVFCASSLCYASTYSLKDLESLSKRDEFQEYFIHAKDIAPHLRNDRWKSLTIKTFSAYLEFIERFTPIAKRDFQRLLVLNSWKILREDQNQLVRMNTLLKSYLIEQLQSQSKPEILEAAKILWGQNHDDYTIGFPLGQAILKHDPKNTLALQMIASGFKSPVADIYCADSSVHSIIKSELGQMVKNLAPAEDFDVKMSSLINRKCWESLKPSLLKTLENPKISIDEKNLALNILDSDYSTEDEVKTYSQFLYLMDSPEKSKALNKSWDTLQKLKRNPELREKILTRIENLDNIPDRTFKNLKEDQNYYLAKNILTNFPEFSNVYAKKCLHFLNGKSESNPTAYCQNFYRILRNSDYKVIAPLAYEGLTPYFKNLKSVR